MPAKVTKSEVKRQVYGAIAAWLRRESQCDVDDPDFIDFAMSVQEKIADDFERKAEKLK